MTRRIDIVEVGPRDGLQNDPGNLSTDQKLEFISRLEDSGVNRMESEKNQRMSPQQSADMLAQCAPLVHEANVPLSATVSVAFGDPYTGEVDPAIVANLAAQAQRAGVAEVGLGDTIGVATPWDVRRVIERVRTEAPDVYLRLHFHDTRGAGLANVAAAVEAGVDVIDASCGGIGGCPFAPAATGNVATEDVVYMLERAGFETGLDLSKLIETAKWLETALGHPVSSSLSRAGGFPT